MTFTWDARICIYVICFTSSLLIETEASATADTAIGYNIAIVSWRILKYWAIENTLSADIWFPRSTYAIIVKNNVVRSVNTKVAKVKPRKYDVSVTTSISWLKSWYYI